MDSTRVCIGIQARSGSKRLPCKVFEKIGDKMLLEHVIERCRESASYQNSNSYRSHITVTLTLLIPTADKIKDVFGVPGRGPLVHIMEGSEPDVLSRYDLMVKKLSPDYIVRITGDCPLIPSALITKHIHSAVKGQYDYFSNVDESCRTAPDGHDCEVISRRAFDWLLENATSLEDREHVTLKLRRQPPSWLKSGHLINPLDLSPLKLSVDTEEDLERVRQAYNQMNSKLIIAREKAGPNGAHRF